MARKKNRGKPEKRVEEESSIKASSVAAFMFMPQFRFCFQQFDFIVPVFMRLIGGMFVAAGLLPEDHPSIRYGVPGVEKRGFLRMMGEAWRYLRTAPAPTPRQWSLFGAVVMMAVMIVSASAQALLAVSGMFVSTASAQFFELKDMGTGQKLDTDIATIPAQNLYNVPPNTTGHGDYAIMMLDKLLRQGTDVTKSSPLQSAFGGLMETYNSGIMLIAGVILFWLILTIVVDTARTGQIGGGRHNLVWAPIRIVFALGLMIPLGSSGFSSGQYMVMKLAEWGSNFGSNAWSRYVKEVVNTKNLVGQLEPDDARDIVKQYVEMWVCRVTYNGYNIQTGGVVTGQLFNPQMIYPVLNGSTDDPSKKSFSFTNRTGENICGTLSYPDAKNDELMEAKDSGDPLLVHLAEYEETMSNAYAEFFIKDDEPDEGTLSDHAKKLACTFVGLHLYGATPADNPLLDADVCGQDYGGQCGDVPVGGTSAPSYPKAVPCVFGPAGMVKKLEEGVRTAMVGGGDGGAWEKLDDFTKSPDFMADIKNRGWAGMGAWYRRISQLNATVSRMQQYPISISKGAVLFDMPGFFDLPKMLPSGEHLKTVIEVTNKYNVWWETVVLKDPAGKGGTDKVLTKSDGDAIVSALKSGNRAGAGNVVTSKVAPSYKPSSFVKKNTGSESSLYPLALLSMLGNIMLVAATVIYAGLIVIPVVIGAFGTVPLFGGGAAAIAQVISSNPMWAMFGALAGALLTSGAMLSFWIPILPLIRVAFGALTWMIAVFEAVVMVPIAALAHLTTEGDGIAGGAKGIWVIWLNILLRPILMVIGFVGALLGFNTFVVYFSHVFWTSLFDSVGTFKALLGIVFYTVLYVGTIYTVANSIFKLIDLIPAAVSKYLGGPADTSFDQDVSGFISGTAGLAKGMGDAGAAGALKHGQAIGNAINVLSKKPPDLTNKT